MQDDRLIDVYDVTTGILLDRLSQWEALRRILIHERIQPDNKTIERNRYKINGVLGGNPFAAFNLLYCCTEPEPERLPTPPSEQRECPKCAGTGVGFSAPYIRADCEQCKGTGNLD